MDDAARDSDPTSPGSITRRAALFGIAGIAALGLGGTVLGRYRERERSRLLDEVIAHLELAAVAPHLGRPYLEAHPDEADDDLLLDALVPRGAGPDRASLERQLAERIDHEYLARDLVVADGWVLARTEARLLARATLTASRESDGA